MNCETFQTILQDLGKDSSVDLRTRQDGLAHVEGCPECAARLKDECRLVAGLGALAASFTETEASAKVEEVLLKTFRDRAIKQEVEELRNRSQVMEVLPNRPTANNSPLTLFPSPPMGARGESFLFDTCPLHGGEGARRAGEGVGAVEHDLNRVPWRGLQNGWAVRIAAVSLLVLSLTAWFWWQTSRYKPEEIVHQQKPDSPEGIPQAPSLGGLPSERAAVPKITRSQSLEAKVRRRAIRKRAIQSVQSQNPVRQADPRRPEVEDYSSLDRTEIATEFLPLSYGDPIASSLEGGQLVRVRLPRTTLLSFGFPMSEERSPEPIKADVLLGEDGMARAIRFVH